MRNGKDLKFQKILILLCINNILKLLIMMIGFEHKLFMADYIPYIKFTNKINNSSLLFKY